MRRAVERQNDTLHFKSLDEHPCQHLLRLSVSLSLTGCSTVCNLDCASLISLILHLYLSPPKVLILRYATDYSNILSIIKSIINSFSQVELVKINIFSISFLGFVTSSH